MKTRITIQGRNRKVGFGVPVSTTESDSCPDSCPLKNGICYAKKGRTRLIWDEVKTGFSRRAKKPFSNSWDHFIEEIKYLRPKQLWRHNQAGDLPMVTGAEAGLDQSESPGTRARHVWMQTIYCDPNPKIHNIFGS